MKSINIRYPIRDNTETNSFFSTTQITKDAFSSNLLLLLLTKKGERFYESDYGTNLLKYIFEPNDILTANDIEEEIKNTVSKYIPNLIVNSVRFDWNEENVNELEKGHQLIVDIGFTYNDDSFREDGSIQLNF